MAGARERDNQHGDHRVVLLRHGGCHSAADDKESSSDQATYNPPWRSTEDCGSQEAVHSSTADDPSDRRGGSIDPRRVPTLATVPTTSVVVLVSWEFSS